jgi:hypothetical protein
MHVEDDAGQVADDKDEDNQHEDDGEVLIMSFPSSSPSSEKRCISGKCVMYKDCVKKRPQVYISWC